MDENTDRIGWLRERRAGIGGTDAAVLMGTHVGKVTPRDVYNDKIATDDPAELNLPMFRFGHMLEPRLLAEAEAHHGIKVRPGGLFRNKAESWRYANPDALTSDGGILECKTTGTTTKHYAAWKAGDISPHAYDQTQHYLAVTGRAHARFVVGVNPKGWQKRPESEWVDSVTEIFHVGPIPRDEARIAEILEAERDFWACVEARALSTRWAPREVEARIPEMVEDDLVRLAVIKEQQTKLKADREAIEKRLRGAIGDEGGFLTLWGKPRVSLTAYDAETFDKAGLIEAHPDIAERFIGTAPRTRLSVVDA
ncbi:YqaJ viral recombinase family protein [Nocardioides sp. STR2]|uniref:YqaJ viral recombinase family protein n=1 Tax=Nocardioides pini TaxID=2975053 RepID=A0ABT4CCP9_9ACTN|nr:YqaJ viral recombinase family protein [Nocardioides pini]MCY4726735.1 YqaJ viral recombinase family protein [Nocardioides pini]